MAELKTKPSDDDVEAFIAGIPDETQRADAARLTELMQRVTGSPPRLWGGKMVGFGSYHYTYASGKRGDWFVVGFAPRSKNLTLYIISGFDGYTELLERLGKHSAGKSCLYVKRLADLDMAALAELIERSVAAVRARAAGSESK